MMGSCKFSKLLCADALSWKDNDNAVERTETSAKKKGENKKLSKNCPIAQEPRDPLSHRDNFTDIGKKP